MSDVSGGMRIPPTAGSPTGPSGTPGQVINPPPSALQLVSGDSLGGTVTGTDKLGHLLIKTELGQLSLMTSAKLPAGTQVSLQIRQTGSELYVLIFPSHKKPKDLLPRPAGSDLSASKSAAPASGGPAGSTPTPGNHSSTALRHDTMTLGQKLTATLQALPHKGGNNLSAAVHLPGRPGATAPAVAGPLSAYANPTSPSPLPAGGGLTAGAALSLKMLSLQPPSPASTPLPTASGGNPNPVAAGGLSLPPPEKLPGNLMRFEGLVIGQNGQGRPLMQSPLGLMVLNLANDLPVGSRLVLESETATPPAKTAPPSTAANHLSGVTGGWTALAEALASLSGSMQTSAGQDVSSKIPKADAKLTSSLLFFMSALKSGDISAWLPPLAQFQLKQQGKDDLVQKLGQDFAQLSSLSNEPGGGSDWRLFLLPFMDNSQLRDIRLFMRQGGQGGDGQSSDDTGPEATRFVVDVDLTRLGSMQLDGLVREARFDLVLRSRQELPLLMRNDIARIFETANEISGFQGSVSFHNSGDWHQMQIPGESPSGGNLVV